jgi:arginyl-tRNA synthetase
MNVLRLLQQKFRNALAGLTDDPEPYAALVRPAQDPRFGDYQANCAMPLAKALGRKPREVAEEIVRRVDAGDLLEPPEVAGPGFINLRLRSEWLARRLEETAKGERLGVAAADKPRTVVIDFSSPNVAKPLHVGHLRSTIIGDSLTRLLRFLGHRVITDNHLGDWGTQFGMLLYGYKHFRDEEALRRDPVAEMLRLYLLVRKQIEPAEQEEEAAKKKKKKSAEGGSEGAKRYSEEEKAASRKALEIVRQETAKLHAGDAENNRLWQQFMPWCLEEINRIYRRMGVHFDHTHGESFYNPMLEGMVQSLQEKGIARPSAGAIAIFFGQDEPPALVRKRDGAFTYTTSDLATIRYRMEQWRPDAILYVVGMPQALHFKNLFDAARRWGYGAVELQHIAFGSVLGEDHRPFKTREGGAVELGQLLDEAVERGKQAYEESRAKRVAEGKPVPELTEGERQTIYEVVGLGAVKYADLSQNRTSDYVFSWEKMLATDGNTATYMQYAYARNRSIFREGGQDERPLRTEPPLPVLGQPQERALALQLLRFEEVLSAAATEYQPHLITAYLWDLAKSYSGFYQHCPVLKAPTPELRRSRLLLCDLTARIIQQGLALLGIRTVERM